MGAPLYKNLEGISQSRGLPGGHTTSRSGGRGYGGYGRPTTAKIAPSGGRSGGLSNALSSMTGGNMPVSQPIQPTQMAGNLQGSRSKNIAYASLGLKGIANVMQAIENYKAAQNALIIAQEERDREAEDRAREEMERSKAPLLDFAKSIPEMGEAEGAAMAQAITKAAVTMNLDEQSKTQLDLEIGRGMGMPSEAESAKLKAQATAEGTGLGDLAAFKAGGEDMLISQTAIKQKPYDERARLERESKESEGEKDRALKLSIANLDRATKEKIAKEKGGGELKIADIQSIIMQKFLRNDPKDPVNEQEMAVLAPKLEVDKLGATQLATIAQQIVSARTDHELAPELYPLHPLDNKFQEINRRLGKLLPETEGESSPQPTSTTTTVEPTGKKKTLKDWDEL